MKIEVDHKKIAKVFVDYCDRKNYQVRESQEANNQRLDISNLSERTIVKIYTNSTIQVQGKQHALKGKMEKLKAEFENNPQVFLGAIPEIKACATRYDIMLAGLRTKIREALNTLNAIVEITESPKGAEYRAKLNRNDYSLTITQFNNGTLLLQGKTDKFFHDCCDVVEKIANPSNKDVIARFISRDEESLRLFTAKYTSELTEMAECNVIQKIDKVYDFLEPYDKKYFVAAESLFLANIPLPEYSPIVMPASKAFEGLAKKIVIALGLGSSGSTDFSILNSRENPTRKSICSKETHCDTFLCDLNVAIKKYRHFMMHSDTSNVTKVDSYDEAKEKLEEIYKESKKFFDYFNSVFKLLP